MQTDRESSNHNPVRFSSFEVDLRAGELRKHGIRIKLQDQPFQILAALLENPGEVVTREQLRQRLWPADTFVDFDHSLNSAVKKLRQALNDDPDVPRFIETLPKRGYRFIAALRNGAEAASSSEVATTEAATVVEPSGEAAHSALPVQSGASAAAAGNGTQPSARVPTASVHHWKLWTSGAVGFVLALGLVAWFGLSRPAKVASTEPIRLVPLTAASKAVSKASFSPDGNQIAYAWEGGNKNGIDIYVKQIGTEKPLQLTSDFAFNFFPSWSPDGRYIAFLHGSRDERPAIYILPALGGTPRRLFGLHMIEDCKKADLSWSRDSQHLVFADRLESTGPCSLYELDVATLETRRLTTPPPLATGDSDAEYSPDGSSIAFMRDTKDVEDIYVIPASGGEARRVTFDNRLLSGLTWTPDGKEIVFSSNRGGSTWGLWRIAVSGGTPERVSVGSDRAYYPSLSPKGNRLAYASGFWNEDIWRIPIGPGHRAGKFEKYIFSDTQEEGPQYSPDGKRIVFQSTRSGNFEIWRADADGSNLVQLTNFKGPLTGTAHWSPDGRWICFDTRPGPHANVHIISADGGPVRRFVNETSDDGTASWSHDGRWIYFASNRTGSWQVWKRTADAGSAVQSAPVQMTKNGGFAPVEGPDGKFVYYTKFDAAGVWRMPVEGGEETKVLNDPPRGGWGYMAVGPDGLYFVREAEDHSPVLSFYDFVSHKVSDVGTMEKAPFYGAPGLSVSPDGRYVLYVQLDESRDNLMLAENFH